MEEGEIPAYCGISDFPDSLLLHILTFLPIKTAVRASILSRRWRYLHTAIPSLHFDDADFSNKSITTPSLDATDLFTVVPQFLFNHVSPLNSFYLRVFPKNVSETRVLGGWIRHIFAVRKVKEFSLEVFIGYDSEECYVLLLGSSDCGSILTLKLCGCAFISRDPGTGLTFQILKSLSLSYIVVSESLLHSMLCSCPCLETLSMIQCIGHSEDMKIVSVPRLLNLKIVHSDFENLEIVAPCLQSFEFDCPPRSCDEKSCVRKLCVTGGRLKVLKVGGCAFEVLRKQRDIKGASQFGELQTIMIRPCPMNSLHLEDLASLLGKSTNPPRLQRLCIDHEAASISVSKPNTYSQQQLLQHLRSVSIHSFNATQDELQFVKSVLQSARSLESICIAPTRSMEISESTTATRKLLRLQRMHPQVKIDFLRIKN